MKREVDISSVAHFDSVLVCFSKFFGRWVLNGNLFATTCSMQLCVKTRDTGSSGHFFQRGYQYSTQKW